MRHRLGRVAAEFLLLRRERVAEGQLPLVDAPGFDDVAFRVRVQVPPPLLERVDAPVADLVVQVRQPLAREGKVHGHPQERLFLHHPFQVERTGLHAAPAHGTGLVDDPVAGTLLHVRLPHLVAVEHDLVAEGDGRARALPGALLALIAEVLQAEVDGPVGLQRHVGGDDPGLEARADEGVEHQLPYAAQFAEAGKQDQGNVEHVLVHDAVAAGGKTEPADVFADDAADQLRPHVGAHALCAADPVVPAGAFHGLVTLVHQDGDSVLVIGLDLAAVGVMRVPGVVRDLADADHVRPHVVQGGLHRVRVVLWIVVAVGHLGGGFAVLQRHHAAKDRNHGVSER